MDEHNTCEICKEVILPKEDYIKITTYLCGKEHRIVYKHLSCGEKKDKDNIKKLTLGMLWRTNRLLNKAEKRLEDLILMPIWT